MYLQNVERVVYISFTKHPKKKKTNFNTDLLKNKD